MKGDVASKKSLMSSCSLGIVFYWFYHIILHSHQAKHRRFTVLQSVEKAVLSFFCLTEPRPRQSKNILVQIKVMSSLRYIPLQHPVYLTLMVWIWANNLIKSISSFKSLSLHKKSCEFVGHNQTNSLFLPTLQDVYLWSKL